MVLTAARAALLVFTVNTTDDIDDSTCDSPDCSLCEAISAPNANSGTNTIVLSIAGTGPSTIRPTSALPAITVRLTIYAATQTGFAGTSIADRLADTTHRVTITNLKTAYIDLDAILID